MGRPTLTWERREPGSDVLVVTNAWPDAERRVYGIYVERQVGSLLEAGLRCDVLYLRGYRSPFVYLYAALWFAASSLRLRRRYRLIHAHAGETGFAARFHVGTPLVVSFNGDDLLGHPDRDGRLSAAARARRFLVRQLTRACTATITKSAEMAAVIPGRARWRNAVIPNGVDTSVFRPLERSAARAELGWPAEEAVVLFAATKPDDPGKRLWLAEEAQAIAERELGRTVRLEVAQNVPPDRMPSMMSAADCLLVTSAVEGSPNTVKEALMCDLPVVATPAGDIAELLDGVEPSSIREPDAEHLGDAVARIVESGKRSNGRRVATRLSSEAVAARLLALYRDLGAVDTAGGESIRAGANEGP